MDKTILITGSTDGIGKQTALDLALKGHTVILHGRTDAKCRSSIEFIQQRALAAKLDYVVADLSSLSQVRNLAEIIRSRYQSLHVLINNAGVFMKERVLTVDGNEMTIAVNHLAPFLLTILLLDLLKKSSPSRIITVSSIAHSRGSLDFNDMQCEHDFKGYKAYAASKLANILFSNELAARLRGADVTSNSLHPGVIRTKLLTTGFGNMEGSETLSEGAETSVFLATDDSVASISGSYFVRCRRANPTPVVNNKQNQKLLWDWSAQRVGML